MEAIQFIHVFSPIISKAAMQTYYSALPLMPSDSLLSKKYIAMSRPSLKSSGSRYSQIIHNSTASLSINSREVCNSTSLGDVMVVSLSKGGIGFFDTSTGIEIGSRIPTAEYSLIASSPDGEQIVTCHEDQCAFDIWNVQLGARAHVKAITNLKELEHRKIERITYSADGEKVLIVTSPQTLNYRSSRRSRSSSRSTRRLGDRYRSPSPRAISRSRSPRSIRRSLSLRSIHRSRSPRSISRSRSPISIRRSLSLRSIHRSPSPRSIRRSRSPRSIRRSRSPRSIRRSLSLRSIRRSPSPRAIRLPPSLRAIPRQPRPPPPRVLQRLRSYSGSNRDASTSSYQRSNTSLSYSDSPLLMPLSRSPSPGPPLAPSQSFSRYPPPPILPPIASRSRNPSLSPYQLVFIWDFKTDKFLKQLEVPQTAHKIAISDTSQMAIAVYLNIKIIDFNAGHPTSRLIWSSNGQISASASVRSYIIDLACSPDSSKVVAILGDNAKRSYRTGGYKEREMTLSMWCMRSGSLVGTTSFKSTMRSAAISFTADGRDILICCYDELDKQASDWYYSWESRRQPQRNAILLRFSVIPTHLETYMHRSLKFHPSQTPHTIEYSHYISGNIDDIDFAPHVDADGWILNTKGEREIWTPWADYEILCSCKPPPKGQMEYRTLEVKDPDTKTVVLTYVIAFGHYRSKPLPAPPGT